MDEPFSALDPNTRGGCASRSSSCGRRPRKTIVFVTHDVDEALMLADRIVVLSPSRRASSRRSRLARRAPRGVEATHALRGACARACSALYPHTMRQPNTQMETDA